MSTLLNPDGGKGKTREKPANPFQIYVSWKSTKGEWQVYDRTAAEGQQKKTLKGQLNLIVLDYLQTIKGGRMEESEVFSYPCYRYVNDMVQIWEKTSEGTNLIAEGRVKDIYPTAKKTANAAKSCQAFVFIPKTGQLAVVDFTGYALSPFYGLDQNFSETPGISLEIDAKAVDPQPKWGERFAPIVTTWAGFDPAMIEAAIQAAKEGGVQEYINYLLGKETKKNTQTPEKEQEKNSDPWG